MTRHVTLVLRAHLPRLVALASQAGDRPVNPRPGHGYRIEAAESGPALVYVYDEIGPWGVDAAGFVRDLAQVTQKRITLHVNSGGGDVFDAIAMHAALVNHPATVTARVDGLAASAASFLIQAADRIIAEKPAQLMIHDARGLAYDSPTGMQVMTDLLGQISDTIAQMYADRAGGTAASWRKAMQANSDKGTWYTSAAALDAGLVDEVANDSAPPAPADRRTQLIRARARVLLKG